MLIKIQSLNMESLGNMKKFQSLGDESNEVGGVSGYGLRENPKRTWRAVDSSFALPQERVCKQCGKGFQSLKALCGHMACHSEKEKVSRDTNFWTNGNSKLVDSHSDTDEDLVRQTRSKTKRYKKSVGKASEFGNNVNGGSSVFEVEEQDMEDVAMCLMMLSRDTWNWGGVNSVVESSDNNSVVLETKSSSIDMKAGRNDGVYFGDEILEMKKLGDNKFKTSGLDTENFQFENCSSGYLRNGVKKLESDISIDELLRNGEYKDAELGMIYNRGNHYEAEACKSTKLMMYDSKKRARDDYESAEPSKNAQKKRNYNCVNCNKSFSSFQALGGHRPCHKRTTPTFHFEYESDDYSLDDEDIAPNSPPVRKLGERYDNKKAASRDYSVDAKKKIRPKKVKGHQCPFCPKMFKSGQALGGHKRTHFLNAPIEFRNPSPEIRQEAAAQEGTTSGNLHEATATRNLIDLNLPAPEQDDEFDESNQFICLD
ncbi:putative WRKY transcription factor 57-like [Heracleum sosnowskyi]|uniref:WRKY transcription factor 57-like n=1 Tax=Heracleum sosnowskyi TaxID=360622 RepID=A0AAD8I7U5_9APIA|nr:putative WRKY transcription factor 57-like [Heracleum sosnowskyi]